MQLKKSCDSTMHVRWQGRACCRHTRAVTDCRQQWYAARLSLKCRRVIAGRCGHQQGGAMHIARVATQLLHAGISLHKNVDNPQSVL